VAAWLVLIEGKMFDAKPLAAVRAASGSHLFTDLAGLLRILLKHHNVPPA
jgi:hypothetical protein